MFSQTHFAKANSGVTLKAPYASILLIFFLFSWGAFSSKAYADPLQVTAIQWVQGKPEIPHTAVNDQSTILQAIAEHGTCAPNYRYRWDWNGDGDYG